MKIEEIETKLRNMLNQALEDANDELKLTDDQNEIESLEEDKRLAGTWTEIDMNKMIKYVIDEDACDESFFEAVDQYMGWD